MLDAFAGASGTTITLVVGVLPIVAVFWPGLREAIGNICKSKTKGGSRESFPADGVWDLDKLAKFNGAVNPLCLGVCGKIVDCSSSENIKYNEGAYGTLWAGNDATYSLATLSLEKKDVNKFDFKLSDLTAEQHKALAGWYKHFTTKYNVVGTLKEWEGFDFSSVFEEAKSQTPFGAAKTEDTPLAMGGEGGTFYAMGDRVEIHSCEGERQGLNGLKGVLLKYNPEQKGFEIKLDATNKVEIIGPAQLKRDGE